MDDEIVEFGSVNAQNFQSLQNIGSVVQHSEGVSRGYVTLELLGQEMLTGPLTAAFKVLLLRRSPPLGPPHLLFPLPRMLFLPDLPQLVHVTPSQGGLPSHPV